MPTRSFLYILLVEDSKGDALLVNRALHQALPAGCDVHAVETMGAALKALAERQFDVALLDHGLPDVIDNSGLVSLRNMAPKLPIVFLTAYKNDRTATQAIEEGAQDYLFKDELEPAIIRRAIQFAIPRKKFENALAAKASSDYLTGLSNRMQFETHLTRALSRTDRHGGGLGVLYLDLNNFKPINDVYGHAVGDRVLAEIGARIKSSLRFYDTAARLGGDEFAVLLDDAVDAERCSIVARRLISTIGLPFAAAGVQINVGVSIGIVLYTPGSKCSCREIMQRADMAMYEAKKSHSNVAVVWKETQAPPTQQSVA